MPVAHVKIGAAEVEVNDVLNFLSSNSNITITFSTQELLELGVVIAAYAGPLNTTTLKDILTKAGINYV